MTSVLPIHLMSLHYKLIQSKLDFIFVSKFFMSELDVILINGENPRFYVEQNFTPKGIEV